MKARVKLLPWKPLLILLTAVILLLRGFAQSVPQPGIVIAPLSTNRMQITITNGVGWANYELYRRTTLDYLPGTLAPIHPWLLHQVGTQGQQGFVATNGIAQLSFFQVAVGLDSDGDGVLNSQDAQPFSTNAGLLSITIDFPLNNGKVP